MTILDKAIIIAIMLVLETLIAFATKLGVELAKRFVLWFFENKNLKGKKPKHQKRH